MTLFKLLNQKKNLEFLQQAVKNDKIANGYLFYGPEGSGSEGFAMEFAAMLNCTGEDERPCGHCGSCQKMKKLEHGNVTLVYPIPGVSTVQDENPVAKLSNEEIEKLNEQIREKAENPYKKIKLEKSKFIPISLVRHLKRNIYLSAPEKGWKVILVFDADMMNNESANAFLKILEEPPEKTTLLLTTSRIGKIIPTIKSRCKPLFFNKLSNDDIKNYLMGFDYTEEQIRLLVNLADGNMTSLINLMGQDIKFIKEMTLDILRTIAGWDRKRIFSMIPELAKIQKEDSELFVQILTAINFWFRDAEMLRHGVTDKELVHFDQEMTIRNFLKSYADFDAYEINQVIDNCIDFINRNVYINVALMDMFFKIKKLIGKRN
ncbi:MAG: hypothetical protein JXQ65_03445 [Candidatus Marinimicrobia bacterium]|nr:hypothetical protein [Candidatus Neomarinimicrobiota bacterium]